MAGAFPAYAQQTAAANTLTARIHAAPGPATYIVRMLQGAHPRLAITATLQINGNALEMDTTRPADVPEVGSRGWPALVRDLRVSDATGRSVEATSVGAAGWKLTQPYTGLLTLEYEVDYSLPAAHGWPAPREAAFADSSNFVFVGRSLFITTGEVRSSIVKFALPNPWRPVTPWHQTARSANAFSVESAQDLTQNLLVLSRSTPDVVTAGGFRLLITHLGHWQHARPEVNRVLRAVLPRFVRLMGFEGRDSYSVVLLPHLDRGGESYHHSFAFTVDTPPTKTNRASWAHTIAHEIFHYWNGWRLRGSDYAGSQWFQEGFTDYAANLAMVESGLINPDEFRQLLSEHLSKYRNLGTSLEAPGTRKGPPLYSGGALVAFSWDVQIRHATNGKRNLGHFLRALWRQTNGGQREYAWSDIRAALNSIAPLDWEAFFRTYIRGTEKLPPNEVLSRAALRLGRAPDGSSLVEIDPLASTESKLLWVALVRGR